LIYAAALALFWHSIFTDPNLKNSSVDFFDGEKVFIELCLLAVASVGMVRWRYAIRKSRLQPASQGAAKLRN